MHRYVLSFPSSSFIPKAIDLSIKQRLLHENGTPYGELTVGLSNERRLLHENGISDGELTAIGVQFF